MAFAQTIPFQTPGSTVMEMGTLHRQAFCAFCLVPLPCPAFWDVDFKHAAHGTWRDMSLSYKAYRPAGWPSPSFSALTSTLSSHIVCLFWFSCLPSSTSTLTAILPTIPSLPPPSLPISDSSPSFLCEHSPCPWHGYIYMA